MFLNQNKLLRKSSWTKKFFVTSPNSFLNNIESFFSTYLNVLEEVELNLEEVEVDDKFFLKKRNDVYYEMYREALRKAKLAKDLALSSYLEATRIKNLYMLNDLNEESDLDDESFDFTKESS